MVLSSRRGPHEHLIVTASLTTGIARVTHGMQESVRLVDAILATEHNEWESVLCVVDIEFYRTKDGPFPNHQLRVSVRPSVGFAALNYMDHDDPEMPIMNSFNRMLPWADVNLIFNGSTGLVFPGSAAIPVAAARNALVEWLETRKQPTCVEWRAFDGYRSSGY
jgi:hypothetical protein